MDIIDIKAADQLINNWANAFRGECEAQFPGQGGVVFCCTISMLYCELFRMFDPETILRVSNARLAGGPYRVVTVS